MGTVIFDTSMSLDGFMAGAGVRPEEPLGEGGGRLHDWAMGGDERGSELLGRALRGLGAVIAGRRTYDLSVPWWRADGPTGPARRPVFVLTHSPPAEAPEEGVYTFVTDGVEGALRRAQAAAGDGDVCVMGGASVGQQFIRAGLVDELQVHLVPVILGDGIRMFEHLAAVPLELETAEVEPSAAATHLRYRVVRRGGARGT